jgi:hypothetical protein
MYRRVLRDPGSTAAALMLLAVLLAGACGGTSTAPIPAPTPTPLSAIEAGARSGPVQIEYVAASIEPGSAVSGCGPQLADCLGRLTMTFRLRATAAAPVLRADARLHGTNNLACLSATAGAFEIDANVPHTMTMGFDRFDAACPVPVDIRHMSLTLSGPTQTDSRQEWRVNYTFTP